MGNFGAGVLQGVSDLVQKKVDENHAEQEQRNTELRKGLWGIAYDPNQPEAVRQNAQDQLQKLYPTQKKPLQKFGEIFHGLAQHLGGSQQPDQGQPTPQGGGLATPQTPAPQSGATPTPAGPPPQLAMPQTPAPSAAQASQGASPGVVSAQLATPKTPAPTPQQFQLPPAPTDAQLSQPTALDQRQLNMAQAERDRRQKTGTTMGLSGRDLAEFTETGKMPTGGAPGTRRAEKWELPDGSKVDIDYDPKLGARYTADGQIWDPPSGAKRTDKPVNTQLAWFSYPGEDKGAPPHAVRVDPRDPTKSVDASTGKPIPEGATQVNTGIIEQQIRQNSYGQFGNLFRAIKGAHPEMSDQQASDLAGQQVEADYQKRQSLLGAGHITEAYGIGGTQTHIVPGTSPASSPSPSFAAPPPSSEGAAAGSSATPSPAPVPVSPPKAPLAPVSPLVKPPAVKQSASPKGPSGIVQQANEPVLTGASLPQATQAGTRFAPVAAAVTEIFGDPKQPDLHPLMSYADLAGNKESQKRIGTAINLTQSLFGDRIQDAGVGIGVGPVSISAGGFGAWLSNQLGGPTLAASSQAETLRKAIEAMTPREREAYDSTMATMSTMSGLRSINRGSAALGSIERIDRELPKIGINATSASQFYDQLQRTAGFISNYVNTPELFPLVRIPQSGQVIRLGTSPEMLSHISGLTSDLQKKKAAASVSPKGKASLKSPGNAPKNADQYLQSIGVQ